MEVTALERLQKKIESLTGDAEELQVRLNESDDESPCGEEIESLARLTEEIVETRSQIQVLERANTLSVTESDVAEFVGRVQREAQKQDVPVVKTQDTTGLFLEAHKRAILSGQSCGVEIDTSAVWNTIAHARAGTDPIQLVRNFKREMKQRPDGDSILDTRALQVGTDSEGGYLVDDITLTSVVLDWIDRSPMMSISRMIPTPRGETIHYPIADAPAANTSPTAEEATYDTAEPTISEAIFNAYKFTSISVVSDELLQDAPETTETAVRHALLANLMEGTEDRFVQGSGSGQPQGVLSAAQNGQGSTEASMADATFAANTAFALCAQSSPEVPLKGLIEALYTNMHSRGASSMLRFIMPRSWYGALVAISLGSDDGPAFAGTMNWAGSPQEMILGVPVTLLDHGPALPSSASSDDIRFGAVGSFMDAFGIRVVSGGWGIFVNPYRRRHQGQIEFQTEVRCDSRILLNDAIATIQGPTYS